PHSRSALFCLSVRLFSLHDPPTTALYTLSLHDALPIFTHTFSARSQFCLLITCTPIAKCLCAIWSEFARRMIVPMCCHLAVPRLDRKSTRLNSSHVKISYAVFCLKKKKKNTGLLHHAQP